MFANSFTLTGWPYLDADFNLVVNTLMSQVEPSPVLNCKTSCGQLYPQLDLSEFLKAVQPETEDVAEGEEQVLAVGICCVRSARQCRRG